MTRTLILHIGHYKTGTTAVQVFCERNAAALAHRGLLYARTGRALSKHSEFAFSLLRAGGATTLLHGYRRTDPPAAVWAPLLAEVRTAEAPAVLISSEEFMRLALFPEAVAALWQILHATPDIRLKVLAWLRPVGPHLRSWYNQMVKMGRCRVGFQTAVCTQFEAIHHDYARALAPWAELAGPANLILRPYSDAVRAGRALFDDFAAAMGIALPAWPLLPEKDPNPRLDDRLLDLIRLADAQRLPEAERRALVMTARRKLVAAQRLAAAEAPKFAAIRSRAARSVAELGRLVGPDFPLAELGRQGPEVPDPAEAQQAALIEALLHERNLRIAELIEALTAAQARIARFEGPSANSPDPVGTGLPL